MTRSIGILGTAPGLRGALDAVATFADLAECRALSKLKPMGYVTSLFARKMVAAAGGGPGGIALLASVGLEVDAPWDPKAMILAEAYYSMLERLAAQVDATDLPVRVGASMRCDEYGALGLAWKAAPDLRGSLARVERYARLWTSVVRYELRPDPRGFLFIVHRPGERRLGLRLSNETTLIATIALARQVSPAPVTPLEVLVRHPAPNAVTAHEKWFGCPVRWGAECDAILFPLTLWRSRTSSETRGFPAVCCRISMPSSKKSETTFRWLVRPGTPLHRRSVRACRRCPRSREGSASAPDPFTGVWPSMA